jgi:hypothetical protein
MHVGSRAKSGRRYVKKEERNINCNNSNSRYHSHHHHLHFHPGTSTGNS